MSTALGHKAKFGWAPQVTFGTGITPTKFARINPGGFKPSFSQKPILVPTQDSVRLSSYVESKQDSSPGVTMPFLFEGLEDFLKHATGGTPTSTQIGSTGVYTHTFPLGDTLPAAGLSLHWEADAAAMGTAYRYDSCKVNKLTLSQELEKALQLSLEFVGRTETKVTAESASYPDQNMAKWTQVTTLTADAVAYKFSMAEFVLDNALADDIYSLGAQIRQDITRKDVRNVSGKLRALVTSDDLYDLYRNQTEIALAAEWTGPIAAGSTPYALRINVPRIIFTGTPPAVDGHGPIWMDLPWQAFFDGTNDEIGIELDNLLTSIS